MLEKVEALKKEIESFSVSNSDELEKFRLEFLSKNGKIQSMFKMIGKVAKEEKAAFGKSMNDLKNLAQNRFQQFSNEFSSLATTNLLWACLKKIIPKTGNEYSVAVSLLLALRSSAVFHNLPSKALSCSPVICMLVITLLILLLYLTQRRFIQKITQKF